MKMITVSRVSCACLASFLLSLSQPVQLRAEVVNYTAPAADTYVSNGGMDNSQGDTNYGAEASWRTRYPNNNSSNRKGYVRFDLDGLLTSSVEAATLTVSYTSLANENGTSATVQVYGLNHDYVPPEGKLGLDWAETALTSNNAPWAATGSGNIPSFVTSLGSFTISVSPTPAAGAVFSISTPELASFLETFRVNGEDNVTFIFRSTTGTFFSFASKEHATYAAPSLSVVVSSAVPEPAAWATLAGGFVLAFGACRRHRVLR